MCTRETWGSAGRTAVNHTASVHPVQEEPCALYYPHAALSVPSLPPQLLRERRPSSPVPPPSWLPSKRPRGCRRTSAPFPHPPSPLCGRRRPKLLPFFIPFRRPRPTQGGRGGAGRGGSLAEARRLVGVWAAVRWASAQLWGEGNTAGRDGGRVKQEGAETSAGVGGGCHQSQLRGEHRVFPLARSADTRHADSTVPIVTVLFLHPKWTVLFLHPKWTVQGAKVGRRHKERSW